MSNSGKFVLFCIGVWLLAMLAGGSNTRNTFAPTPTANTPHSCFDPDYPNKAGCIWTDDNKSAVESLQRGLAAANERKYRAPTPNWVGDAPKYYQCRGRECGGTQ